MPTRDSDSAHLGAWFLADHRNSPWSWCTLCLLAHMDSLLVGSSPMERTLGYHWQCSSLIGIAGSCLTWCRVETNRWCDAVVGSDHKDKMPRWNWRRTSDHHRSDHALERRRETCGYAEHYHRHEDRDVLAFCIQSVRNRREKNRWMFVVRIQHLLDDQSHRIPRLSSSSVNRNTYSSFHGNWWSSISRCHRMTRTESHPPSASAIPRRDGGSNDWTWCHPWMHSILPYRSAAQRSHVWVIRRMFARESSHCSVSGHHRWVFGWHLPGQW